MVNSVVITIEVNPASYLINFFNLNFVVALWTSSDNISHILTPRKKGLFNISLI